MNVIKKSGGVPDKPVPSSGVATFNLAGTIALALSLALAATTGYAQQQSDDSSDLKLPEDLAAKANADDSEQLKNADGSPAKYQIEETRAGGRLERVTVKRANGLDEVYENKEIDSMFSKAEDEIGETENVRRWTIGTW